MVVTAEEIDAARQGFDDLPAAVAVVRGNDLRIVAANTAYRELIGRPDVVGAPFREACPELVDGGLVELVDRVRRGGGPVTERERRQAAASRPDSTDGDAWFDLVLVPQRGEDSQVTGVLIQLTGVTQQRADRRDTEVAAATSELRYRQAREVALELQEALLPAALPTLPQVRLAAGYRVAEHGQAAGGDWFDATVLHDGRVALGVGDVVGHGVAASTAMGRLRAVLEDVLTRTGDLDQAVSHAERLATRTVEMRASTLCIAVLDPAGGELTYITCGHPPPLVIGADGTSRYLPTTGGTPLGTGTAPRASTVRLDVGDMVILYSDGLIERSGRTLTDGMAALTRVAQDAARQAQPAEGGEVSAPDRVCQLSVELLAAPGTDDDATVLAAQRLDAPNGGYHDEVMATVDSVPSLREGVGAWLAGLGASPTECQDLDLATIELITNVLEHAYPAGEEGPVSVSADLARDGTLRLLVSDRGRWRAPMDSDAIGGRGLWIAESLVDWMSIVHGDARTGGTTVTLRRRLWKPAQVTSRSDIVPARPERSDLDLTVAGGLPPRVDVAGQIDITTIRAFTDQLDAACRGGLRPLVVDLTEVDLLASAGVRVLLSMRERLAMHGHRLDLISATGTPTQTVLDLVGLSWRHEEEDPGDAWQVRA
ncbi:SpoIIE family protein phosphatase [Brachybacterium sacelli]|uniref:Anti-anti-sigma factor n=2 Tax=Brachybacterium sacelli TaxID=173364 RepID=A0ABS4WZR9_9MICO|nr:SpoIIE family protein phosphatase [Brachybacterium sacelli]MBP2381703.1 anti-anti-sigma factor [Brachybacterium sacelli]